MKFSSSSALALIAVSLSGAAVAQTALPAAASPAKEIKLSPGAGKAIIALQTGINAKDPNVPALMAAAKAVAKTPDDRYAIAQLSLKAAVNANDMVAAAAAVDDMAASGFATPAQIGDISKSVAVALYKAQNYDRAAALLARASTLDPSDSDAVMLLADVKSAAGQKAEAVSLMQKALALKTAAGVKASENDYKRAALLAYGAESPAAARIARQWVAAYPSTDSWHNAIGIYRNTAHPDIEGSLALLRLMRATHSLTSVQDYVLLAESAAEQSNYGEAQAVIDEGVGAKLLDPASPTVKDVTVPLKTKAKPTAADLATAEAAVKDARGHLTVGNRFFGAGNYAKAAEHFRAAIAGGADANVANLRLGEALAMAGDKAGATAALKAVTGPLADVAAYWLIYAA